MANSELVESKLKQARQLMLEAEGLAIDNNIDLHYQVRNVIMLGDTKLSREPKHWDSSTEQCVEDPNYMDYY